MTTIKIAEQFSRYPAGRFIQDGPYSGELFRKKFLEPALNNSNVVVVEMDGARGYGSSFLEEAFGGLIRDGYQKEFLLSRLEIKASSGSLRAEIVDYIQHAKPSVNGN
jgi:hypothetical protein